MNIPHYFLAVFGDPNRPQKDVVESGTYRPATNSEENGPEPGDIMLLYCTGGYQGHEMEVPGIGLVLSVRQAAVTYRYLPFSAPIAKAGLDRSFEAEDLGNFQKIRLSSFWLFEISRKSFARAVENCGILWP